MRNKLIKLTFVLVLLLATILQSCKRDNTSHLEIVEVSPEMKAYFVDYEVGTKWIYQDTLDNDNYDTIELVSKSLRDMYDGASRKKSKTLTKEYVLHYKPCKTKDFKVYVAGGRNNSTYVKIDPMIAGEGMVSIENYGGEWDFGVTYFDSIEINGVVYHDVILTLSGTQYISGVNISKGLGLVLFNNMQGNVIKNVFQLIKVEKP